MAKQGKPKDTAERIGRAQTVWGTCNFQTRVPTPLSQRLNYMVKAFGYSNQAELLFDAINSLSAEKGMPALDMEVMAGFQPY